MTNMRVIPLKNIPNQKFAVVLEGQNCILHLFQRKENLYMDLICNHMEIINGAICQVDKNIVVNPTPYFSGMLFFTDLSGGRRKPNYAELNSRFVLCFSPDKEE